MGSAPLRAPASSPPKSVDDPAKVIYWLKSRDCQLYRISEDSLKLSLELSEILSSQEALTGTKSYPIELKAISGDTLEQVLEWCAHHEKDNVWKKGERAVMSEWDTQFMVMRNAQLLDLVMAAYILRIDKLLTFAGQTVANIAKGNKPEEFLVLLNLISDDEQRMLAAAREAAEQAEVAVEQLAVNNGSTSENYGCFSFFTRRR